MIVGVIIGSGCTEADDAAEVATDTAGDVVTDTTTNVSVSDEPPTGTGDDVVATTDANTVIVVTLPPSTEPPMGSPVTDPPPVTTVVSGPPAVAVEAIALLDTVPIGDPDPARPPYIRDEYQPGGWPDLDGDCVSTRHQVLAEQSAVAVTWSADGCFVETGQWTDPYSGEVLTTADEATIDHLIPLAEGHRAGAWAWDIDSKVRFTNDLSPGALVVVSGATNQSKADKAPDQWMPPLEASRCGYAINWIDKKARWGLTVTRAEHDALRFVVASCTAETAPSAPFSQPASVNVTVPTTTTTTTIVPVAGPAEIVLVRCDRYDETVTIANRGGQPGDLSGYRLHDEGDKHSTPLGQWGPLQPGATLTIVTGDQASEAESRVVWKRQNVWNNDGDIAHLVGAGGIQTIGC
ncbi:uncharacterized protein DUF1524 [Ilumatobacter fluminis]|uniref:Uncharacterized protein DUF1524 n=1 Tax=Ilumatobacter fluminis TaxID=467091 RepID=A0A4R7I1K1_9ACTN|nr:lamin tail domain-containing protein [Ilumatobacter fluminis]TDT16476.1 uncharacterized protein DUF1524 [Ilumatobacter fluminis]